MTLQKSVQARLVQYAKEHRVDPNLILTRYAAERFLYRLSKSRHAERFVLKGAMLLVAWLGDMIRPTRVSFDSSSINVAPIREEDAYGGKRVTIAGHLGPARLKVQADIGIGDAAYPDPQWLDYPSLLDLPQPHLRAYRPETSIAEKLHAMVTLGARNSRMRDFFDIRMLAEREAFVARELVAAIRTTFERRATPILETPLPLTPAFAQLEGKRGQWNAFLRKNGLAHADFDEVIREVSNFLLPVASALAQGRQFDRKWPPGGPWVEQ